ncbi:MAG: DoxX family protein [Actinomycetaceae bacterium]|nr:DoxX family protein [Actinomycetaceae bacterium]
MTILRSIARPLLASVFIYDGCDAILDSRSHASRFLDVQPMLEKVGVPPVISSDAQMLAKISGGITAGAGLGFALGIAPRTNAALLAAINLPITLINAFSSVSTSLLEAPDTLDDTAELNQVSNDDPPTTQAMRNRDALHTFLQGAAVAGGLLLAIFDREGKPSLSWRARRAEQRAQRSLHKATQHAAKKASRYAR